jgi:hypothetical protein
MNVTPDRLLLEIGRLTVANQILTEQLAASRQECVRLAGDKQEPGSDPQDVPAD